MPVLPTCPAHLLTAWDACRTHCSALPYALPSATFYGEIFCPGGSSLLFFFLPAWRCALSLCLPCLLCLRTLLEEEDAYMRFTGGRDPALPCTCLHASPCMPCPIHTHLFSSLPLLGPLLLPALPCPAFPCLPPFACLPCLCCLCLESTCCFLKPISHIFLYASWLLASALCHLFPSLTSCSWSSLLALPRWPACYQSTLGSSCSSALFYPCCLSASVPPCHMECLPSLPSLLLLIYAPTYICHCCLLPC